MCHAVKSVCSLTQCDLHDGHGRGPRSLLLEFSVAQWLEHPTSVRTVVGSNGVLFRVLLSTLVILFLFLFTFWKVGQNYAFVWESFRSSELRSSEKVSVCLEYIS